MDISKCFGSDGIIIRVLDFSKLNLKQATCLLIQFEAKWEAHEIEQAALRERIKTIWGNSFLDADMHGHPEDSDLMKDFNLATVLNKNNIYMPGHIGSLKWHILELCRSQYKC
jgi:hypothetical protein